MMSPSIRGLALLTLLFYLALATPAAQAQCAAPIWIGVWPSNKASLIQPRQIFLFTISTTTFSDPVLHAGFQQLGSDIHLYLWSAHDSVPLVVRDRLLDAGTQQLLMQVNRPLLPDSTYELRAQRGAEDVFYFFQNGFFGPEKRKATIYHWQVVSTPDTRAPIWTSTPTLLKTVYEENSEGIENYAAFNYPLQDASDCLVKTTVQHKQSGQQTTSYLISWQNMLLIGWFTCGGNFQLASQADYTVTFKALDANGNQASVSSTAIPFRAPKRVTTGWH